MPSGSSSVTWGAERSHHKRGRDRGPGAAGLRRSPRGSDLDVTCLLGRAPPGGTRARGGSRRPARWPGVTRPSQGTQGPRADRTALEAVRRKREDRYARVVRPLVPGCSVSSRRSPTRTGTTCARMLSWTGRSETISPRPLVIPPRFRQSGAPAGLQNRVRWTHLRQHAILAESRSTSSRTPQE